MPASYHYKLGKKHPEILITVCHASNYIPTEYQQLGLSEKQINSHISYDTGALEVAENIREQLGSSLIYSNFSRLLIDPNRTLTDPTLICYISDDQIIEANCSLNSKEKDYRIKNYYQKYHSVIKEHLISQETKLWLSIHSFNKIYKKQCRDTEIGFLHNKDTSSANFAIEFFKNKNYKVGDNLPYSMFSLKTTLDKHLSSRDNLSKNIPHILTEIRNDIISNSAQPITSQNNISKISNDFVSFIKKIYLKIK